VVVLVLAAAEDPEVRAAPEAGPVAQEVKVAGPEAREVKVAGLAGAMAGVEDVEGAGVMGPPISRTGWCRSGASARSSRVAAGSTSAR